MPQPDETRDHPDPATASHVDRADPTRSHAAPDRTAGYDGDPPAPDARTPGDSADVIPGYAILERIGEGGMGVVYRARQLGLNREVAVKCVLRADAGRAAVARFWAEAEVMAAVRHPHVVQVFELGEHAGRPFMAMELVPGGSLADRLKGAAPMPPRSAAELVERTARGVAAAHEQGIVHRDLKPGNVLLAADDTPKVTDFGLAKRRTADLTRTQAVMGTPAYMAPEQAAGRAKFVGPPADVWALGVVLYECVAGARPFAGGTAAVVLSQIQSAEPVALRGRARGVPRDLDTVVGKCLAKDPEHRYPTATELADDLGRFVRGEPIAARPVGRVERFARWVRRKPTATAAWGFSALAVLLALVVFVVLGFWREAEGARGQAEAARDEAVRLQGVADAARVTADTARAGEADARRAVEREREKLAVFEYGRTIQVAHQEWRDNNVAAALALLDGTRPDLRGWEWRYVHRLCHGQLLTLKGHTDTVKSVAWSPDGGRVVTASWDKTARVWDAKTGAELLTLRGHTDQVYSAAWSPDGAKVATGSGDTVRVWDARTGAELLALKGQVGGMYSAAWSPDGGRVLTSGGYRTARVWDAKTGTEVVTLKGHTSGVLSAAWSPDGERVLTVGSNDFTARVYDARTGAQVLALKHGGQVFAAAWSPDRAKVVTGGDGAACVCDAKTGAVVAALMGQGSNVRSVAWSPDGARVLTTDSDGAAARVWSAEAGAQVAVFRGRANEVRSAAWSPDGNRVVTAGHDDRTGPGWNDRTARVWDARTGAELAALKGHTDWVTAAGFSPDGGRIVTVGADRTVRVWDARVWAEVLTISGNSNSRCPAAWSPDGGRVVTAGADRTRVWDAKTGAELTTLRGYNGWVSPAWSPDGGRMVTGGRDGIARVWDAKTGVEVLALRGHAAEVESAAWGPDGERVVTASWDKTARVWDAKTGTPLAVLKGHADQVRSAGFSPDGGRIVTVGYETARLWDATSGAELATLKGYVDPARRPWSPDGARVVTAGPDGTARVWDARTGAEVLAFKGHGDMWSAEWSPDGAKVLTVGINATAQIWDATTGAGLATLKGHTGFSAWSPDGARVLTVGADSAGIWDATPLDRQFLPKEPAPPPRPR